MEDVNKTVVLKGKASDTILTLKSKIQAQEGININDQRLIFRSEVLRDESTVRSCNIQDGAVLYLGLKQRGNCIYMHISSTQLCRAGSGWPKLCKRYIQVYIQYSGTFIIRTLLGPYQAVLIL